MRGAVARPLGSISGCVVPTHTLEKPVSSNEIACPFKDALGIVTRSLNVSVTLALLSSTKTFLNSSPSYEIRVLVTLGLILSSYRAFLVATTLRSPSAYSPLTVTVNSEYSHVDIRIGFPLPLIIKIYLQTRHFISTFTTFLK